MNDAELQNDMPRGIGIAPYIRIKQEGMTENESRIVEWFLSPGNLTDVSGIKEVALSLGLSEAMIVKVSKILGFSGFRQLRSAIVEYFEHADHDITAELSPTDSPEDVVNKVFNLTVRTIVEGQAIVDANVIQQAAQCFFAGHQRELYGVGGSNSICADVQHKFLKIGLRCNAYLDAHLMMMSASLLQPGDVALVVSHSGRTSDLKRVVSIAKDNGAKIICITHSSNSPIAQLADFNICSPAPETPLLGRNASARILQLTLLDAFYVSVARQDIELANKNLEKTSSITKYLKRDYK
ncbi:transcriptional repressor AlsR [Sodalis sp. RH14]|uniref:transcriptional repressor AlsR n=1 Tax=Sodalis sp. RH14 TaxID=3394329 RepID=UPI0039B5B8DF